MSAETPDDAEATTKRPVSAEKLLHARILIEVESVNQPEACEAAGLSDRTYREHSHDRSEQWLEADRMFAETVRPLLVSLAAGRAARIIKSGSDGPAAQLIIRILGLTDRQEITGKDGKDLPRASTYIVLSESGSAAVGKWQEEHPEAEEEAETDDDAEPALPDGD